MDAVIVAYNTEPDLRELAADSIFRAAFDHVIVVDNASADASREVATRARFHVIDSARNVGFARAVNLGAQHVSGPHFLIMNADVRFLDAAAPQRLGWHLEQPLVGLAAPALILPDRSIQDSARRVPSPLDLVVRRFLGRTPDAVRGRDPVDVDWVAAACVAVDRTVFDSLGGFSERFFLYFEDVDLGVRVRRAGYRVRYDPTITVQHAHNAQSRGSLTSGPTRHHIASALRFYARHPGYLWPCPPSRPEA